jgi:hypothetical protein
MHREEIEQATEVEDEREEVLDEVEDQWYVIIVNNQDIMQGNVHFHQQHVCIVASDHDTEECLTLLVKIQEKRNQNNQNVQWISAEARDEGRNINIVTHGGAKTGK